MSVTRRELRQAVGRRLGDLVMLTATGGSNVTVQSTVDLAVAGNTFGSRVIYPSGGTEANLGEQRKVSNYNKDSRTLSLVSTLPAAVVAGDVIELWNTRGTGWTAEEVNAELATTIRSAAPFATEPALVEVTAAFDRTNPVILVPDPLTFVGTVEFQDKSGRWWPVKRAGGQGRPGWWVYDDGSGRLGVSGTWINRLDTLSLRIFGRTPAAPLLADDDSTTVNAQWVIEQTAAALLFNGIERQVDSAQRERRYLVQQKAADSLHALIETSGLGNGARVRAG